MFGFDFMCWCWFQGLWKRRRWGVLLALVALGVVLHGHAQEALPQTRSNYVIANQASFNQPSHYPLKQTLDPKLYQSVGDWVGRLILPPAPQSQDWVWLEIYHAPPEYQELVGQTIRLEWDDLAQPYRLAATRKVTLSPEAQASQRMGNIHPFRLNNRQAGPLQSLAGARPNDDVIVTLEPTVSTVKGQPILKILTDPVQVPGRYYTVVEILKPVQEQGQAITPPCFDSSCPTELFKVRHYNPISQSFDGPQEEMRIPQVTANKQGVYHSTIHELAGSPAGSQGWYIYGAQDAAGVFVGVAIAPRSLFDLQPSQVLTGRSATRSSNWPPSTRMKGTAHSILTVANPNDAEGALANWQEGDQALVLHLFGGIGGSQAEPQGVIGTITGHFAFGIAEVIRDPLTQLLRFQIQYQQIYSHNPDGIIAGPVQWSEYMGHLQRGWLGARSVTDVLVKLPALTEDYDFDGVLISPMRELKQQLQLMAARYRTGDGTGAALVTPAKSCSQDSSQAVYTTVKVIEEQIRKSPNIQDWLHTHPDHPQTQRFQTLVALGERLDKELVPLGIARSDWRQNAEVLTGIRSQDGFTNQDNVVTQILSWRTIIPRVVHDQLIGIFRDSGAQLWFLRTNQVGGWNARIAPLEATELFGEWPVVPRVFSRLIEALTTFPSGWGWLISVALLLVYALVALTFGWQRGFIKRSSVAVPRATLLTVACGAILTPALLEEIVFRALLVPHPSESVLPQTTILWSGISLVLFIVYHPLNALTAYRNGNPTFMQPTFLILAALLGVACTLTYLLTSSLWPGVIFHWLVVVVWLLWLGGLERLRL